ncbi:MAG: hypothetical protein AAF696_15875 [Bacteroidota bacterium]
MKQIIFLLTLSSLLFFTSCERENPLQLHLDKESIEKRDRGQDDSSTGNDGNTAPSDAITCEEGVSDVFILTVYPTVISISFDRDQLIQVLEDAGESNLAATDRADIIFKTANNSPQYMGETAEIIGDYLFPDENAYTASYWNFLDEGMCIAGCTPSLPGGQAYNGCAPGDISNGKHLEGSFGDVPQIQLDLSWVVIGATCGPSFSETLTITEDDIKPLLTKEKWLDLWLGNYTQRECWNLFQYEIVPNLQAYKDAIDPTVRQCYVLNEIGFLYTPDLNNELSRTSYKLEGEGRLYCGPID